MGINQGFGLSLSLPRLVGHQRAAEMLYTARRIGGEEAVAWGLCDRLVEPAALDDTAYALASEIARSSPAAVAASRSAIRAELVSGIEDTAARRDGAAEATDGYRRFPGRRASLEREADSGISRVVGGAETRVTDERVLYPSSDPDQDVPNSE